MVTADTSSWREIPLSGKGRNTSSLSNSYRSAKYSLYNFIFLSVFQNLHNPLVLWITINFSLRVIFKDTTLEPSTLDTSLIVLYFALFILRDFIFDLPSQKRDSMLNNRIYSRWTGEDFEPIKSKDIQVGHIIKLNLHESAPADLLLISTLEKSKIAFINEVGKPGELIQKQCVDVTHDFILNLELNKLGGFVKVEPPTCYLSSFRGKIQLSSDYKEHWLGPKNFVSTGSVLESTSCALGLVLYTGQESKIFKSFPAKKSKKSKFQKTLNAFLLYLIVVHLILTMFCICMQQLYTTDHETEIETETVVILILYNKTVAPLVCFIIYEIAKILQVLILSFKYKVWFNTAELSTELGQIEYCVITKEALTSNQDLEVSECIVNGKIFTKDKKQLQTLPSSAMKQRSSDERRRSFLLNNYIDNPPDDFEGLVEDSFSEDLAKNVALASIVATHQEKVYGYSNEDEVLARFSASLGCIFSYRTPTYCELTYKSKQFFYSILGFEKFSKKSLYSSVIVTDENQVTTLFVKGSLANIQEFLAYSSINQRTEYKDYDKKLMQKGLKSIVIASKVLNSAEHEYFVNAYNSIVYGKNNMKQMKAALFKEFLKYLNPMCIIGIKTSVQKQSKKLFESLSNCGIKTWIVSHDSSNTVLNTAKSAGILQKDVPVLKLYNIKSVSQCKKSLLGFFEQHFLNASQDNYVDITRNIIDRNDKSMDANPISEILSDKDLSFENVCNGEFNTAAVRCAISIDKVSLDTALKEEACKKILVSLMFASDCVCFSRLGPKRKQHVVKLLKKNLKFRPSVLAIGNDLGDLPMIKEANLGICCSKGDLESFSDLCVTNIEDIKKLVICEGYFIYSRFSRVILILFLKKLTILVINSYFYFVSCFSGTLLINQMSVIDLIEIFILPSVFFLALFDRNSRIASEISIAYSEGTRSKFFRKRRFFKLGAKSIVMGSLIWGFLYFSYPEIISKRGNESDFAYFSLASLLVCYVVIQFEIFLKFSKLSWGGFLSLIAGISIMAVSFFLITAGYVIDERYTAITDLIVLPLTMVTIVGVSLTCIVCRLSCHYLFKMLKKKNYSIKYRLEEYSYGLSSVYRRSGAVRDYKEGSLEINPWNLLFYNKDVEEAYEESQSKRLIQTYRLILIISFFGLGIAMLDAVILHYDETNLMSYMIIMIVISILFFLSLVKSYRKYKMQTIIFILLFTRISLVILNVSGLNLFIAYSFPVISFSLSGSKYFFIYISNSLNILLYIITIFVIEHDTSSPYEKTLILVLLFNITYNYAIMKYNTEKTYRAKFALGLSMKNTIARNNSILKSLLPEFVLSRVKSGIRYISEDKGIVTVMFCYICDFEKINAEYSSWEISAFLNSLFNQFDLICQNAGVTKIETVGNTYMGCSGLKDSEEHSDFKNISQGIRAVQAAIEMLRYAKKVKLKDGSRLRIKIGIKTGKVTAGVVGFHKPQFSLVGDTVNTASRLCSTAGPFQIQICEKTRYMIKDRSDWRCEEHQVHAKGLGLIKTYLVNRLDNSVYIVHNTSSDASYNSIHSMKTNRFQETYKVRLLENPCRPSDFYKEYRKAMIDENKRGIFMMQFGLLLNFGLMGVINYLEQVSYYNGVFYVVKFFATLPVLIFFKHIYKSTLIVLGSVTIITICVILKNEEFIELSDQIYLLKSMNLVNLVIYGYGLEFVYVIVYTLVIFIRLNSKFLQSMNSLISREFIFLVVFYVFSIYSGYMTEKKRILQVHYQKGYQQELDISEQLLQNLMPKWVLLDLMNDKDINDDINKVTLLYADIVGFTSYSNNRSPSDVIEMLSLLFTKFDKLCLTHNVYKVYTIGDCYVVMGCTDKSDRCIEEECLNVVNMAINMIEIIRQTNSEFDSQLNMRIGIHTGNISGAITGTTIVRYDIYGTDVAVASKMESEGMAGRIKVSDRTKEILEKTEREFAFEHDGKVELKSLEKSHDSYFLIHE